MRLAGEKPSSPELKSGSHAVRPAGAVRTRARGCDRTQASACGVVLLLPKGPTASIGDGERDLGASRHTAAFRLPPRGGTPGAVEKKVAAASSHSGRGQLLPPFPAGGAARGGGEGLRRPAVPPGGRGAIARRGGRP